MRILVLNGSPRPKGNTKQMVDAFREGAESAGHKVDVVDVCGKKIAGCLACEYCPTKGIFWNTSALRTWEYLQLTAWRTVRLQN